MRPLTLALAAGLLCTGQTLATDYGRERTLRVASEAKFGLETVSFEMKVDGEPVERPDGGPGEMSSELTRKAVLVDHVLEGEGSRPKKVRRTFETLAETSAQTFGEESRDDSREGPLQGLVLELSVDEEGHATAELIEGQSPDDGSLLEGHELALGLDALLPSEEVEAGASWELDVEAVKRALSTVLDARLFPEPEPSQEGGGGRGGRRRGMRGGMSRLLASIQWEGRSTLVELAEERDGETCALVEIELEGQGDMPEPRFRGAGGRSYPPEPFPSGLPGGTITVRLEGKFFFSTARRAPVALELEGEVTADSTFEGERDGHSFSSHSTQEGDVSVTITVAEE